MFVSSWEMESFFYDIRIFVFMRDIELKKINSKEVCIFVCILIGRKIVFLEKV